MRIRIFHIVCAVIITCSIQYGLHNIAGVQVITQIDDILIIFLAGMVLVRKIEIGSFTLKKSPLDLFVIAFSILFFASGLLNRVPLINFLLSWKSYWIYVIFYYCLINSGLTIDEHKKLIKLLIFIFVLQLPIILVEFMVSFLTTGGFHDDFAHGTIGGANRISYSVFAPLIYVSYMVLAERKRSYLPYLFILFLVLVIPMGEFAIASYAAITCFFFLKWMRLSIRNTVNNLCLIIPVIIFLSGFSLLKSSFSKHSKFASLNPIEWYYNLTVKQNDVYSGAQRNLYFLLTYNHVNENSAHPLVGMGPGMYASYVAYQLMPETNLLVYDAFGQMEKGMDPGVDSQIIPIWGEFGYGGLLIFGVFLVSMAFYFYSSMRKFEDPGMQAVTHVSFACALFLLLGFYVNHLWEIQPVMMTVFFFWACFENMKNQYSEYHRKIPVLGSFIKET